MDIDIGANPSAEEAEEAVDSGAKKVVDLQDAFRLQEGPSYSKKELMTYLKARAKHSRQPHANMSTLMFATCAMTGRTVTEQSHSHAQRSTVRVYSGRLEDAACSACCAAFVHGRELRHL